MEVLKMRHVFKINLRAFFVIFAVLLVGSFKFVKAETEVQQNPERESEQESLREACRTGYASGRYNNDLLKICKAAADLGGSEEMYVLGMMYTNGGGKDGNFNLGLRYLNSAAQMDHLLANVAMAKLVGSNDKNKISYFANAARLGDDSSKLVMAQAYLTGKDVPKDVHAALNWARQIHNVKVRNNALFEIHCGKDSIKPNPIQAFSEINEVRDELSWHTSLILGKLYLNGVCTPVNLKIGHEFFKQAADMGGASAIEEVVGELHKLDDHWGEVVWINSLYRVDPEKGHLAAINFSQNHVDLKSSVESILRKTE